MVKYLEYRNSNCPGVFQFLIKISRIAKRQVPLFVHLVTCKVNNDMVRSYKVVIVETNIATRRMNKA